MDTPADGEVCTCALDASPPPFPTTCPPGSSPLPRPAVRIQPQCEQRRASPCAGARRRVLLRRG